VDGAQVGVLKEAGQVGLCSLLDSKDGRRLEAQVRLEVLGDLAHQPLEGELTDQELRALLVLADLTQSNRAGAETVGFLDAAERGGRLAGGFSGKLLPRRLAPRAFAGGLFGASHCCW